MRIYEMENYDEMSRQAANIIAAQITLQPESVLGLATGSSPIGTYEHLAKLYEQGDLDFSGVTTFNLDEYVGLPADNDQSYRYFMEDNLFNKVNISPDSINFLNGMSSDAETECHRYEQAIIEAGGIDLQLLGIGHNGHIAFNEPSDRFERSTFQVELTQSTIDANKRFFASIDDVPRKAYTMGIGTIMAARKILVVVSGADKAETVKAALTGPVTAEVPASILQFHQDVVIVADQEALSRM